MTETKKPFWVGWRADFGHSFLLYAPWWLTTERIFCAAVMASSVEEAKELIENAHEPPRKLVWLFVDEKDEDWSPFGKRFPRKPWMRWPWPEPPKDEVCMFCGGTGKRMLSLGIKDGFIERGCEVCAVKTETASEASYASYARLGVTEGHEMNETWSSIQKRIARWVDETLRGEDPDGIPPLKNRTERAERFLEEAIELVQALGMKSDKIHALVDYVMSRPVGQIDQEIGGSMVTLYALAASCQVDADAQVLTEVMRIETPKIRDKVRRRQKEKREVTQQRRKVDEFRKTREAVLSAQYPFVRVHTDDMKSLIERCARLQDQVSELQNQGTKVALARQSLKQEESRRLRNVLHWIKSLAELSDQKESYDIGERAREAPSEG